ncbi:MAG TPA: hypothetical protein VLS44_08905 [Nitrospira sp.]|nr:hypothetical protein [Nitrospira sp.]
MPMSAMATTRATGPAPSRKPAPSPGLSSRRAALESSAVGLPLFLQRKLAVSQPTDPYEREADRVADQVLRMPEPGVGEGSPQAFGSLSLSPQLTIQRQEAEPTPSEPRSEAPRFLRQDFDLRLDWFEMTRPFYTRGAESLLFFDDRIYESIGTVWRGNYDFFFRFGLGDSLSADAANFFTPFGIDSALKHDYLTASERFEREADISSLIISPTVFQFDLHDIPGTLRLPFLKVFGVDQPNPYARGADR